MFTPKLFVSAASVSALILAFSCAALWLTPQIKAQTVIDSPAVKPAVDAAAKKSDVAPVTQEKAVKLLAEVAAETGQFASAPNRVRGQIAAADLFWERDEKAARALFLNALNELQGMFAAAGSGVTGEDEDESANYTARYSLSQLRSEYLLKLAPRDPRAALAALQSLKIQAPFNQENDPLKDDELELQIAAVVAKKDPQQAYDLAAKNLKDGVTYNTMTTLADVYKSDAELGAKLSRDILAKLKISKIRTNTNPPGNTESGISSTAAIGGAAVAAPLDLSLVAQFMTSAAALNRQAERGVKDQDKKILALTDAEMRELSDFIAQSFNRQTTPEPWAIVSATPLIAKYSPNAAQLIRRRLNAEQTQMIDSYGDSSTYYEDRDTKTPDEILADAEKVVPAERDSRYADAINKALEKDDLEKAEAISAKIKDKKSYEYVFDQIKAQIPTIKARRGDVAEVRKLLAAQSKDEEKVATLTELVVALAGKGDKEAAEKLLDEANQLLPPRLKRKPNLESTLQIAGAFAFVLPERSFNLIENSISQMNDVISAGLLLDDFYESGATENDELSFETMQRQGSAHAANSVALVKNLAAADFDRTVHLADKFARPEIRTFVRLTIAESLLNAEAEENEKKLQKQLLEGEGGH